MTNQVTDIGPLDWRVSIVDKSGRPSPEFQRRWNTNRNNTSLITGITFGSGPPTGTPKDGQEYVDTSTDPMTLYIGQGNMWNKFGTYLVNTNNLSDLTNVPTARTNLGLGTMAVQNANAVNITGGSITVDNKIISTLNTAPVSSLPPTALASTPIRLIGVDGSPTIMEFDSYGTNGTMLFRATGGTGASPSAVTSGSTLGALVFQGYTSSNAFSNNSGSIQGAATETYSASGQGFQLNFRTTPTGSNASRATLVLDQDGGVKAQFFIKTNAYTVATLPSASTSGAGSQAFVTDAATPAFQTAVVGGGTNKIPVYSDGTNWLPDIVAGGGGGGGTPANPTATASDVAVNGSATTYMRSDAAPAVQKLSSTQFGLAKVDGTSIGSAGGVISTIGNPASLVYQDGTVPAGNTISNTAADTAFTSSYTIPANSLAVGSVLYIECRGYFSTAVLAPSLVLNIKLGGTTVLTTGTMTGLIGSIANNGWGIRATMIVTAIGTSGTLEAQGVSEIDITPGAGTSSISNMVRTTAFSMDTTANKALTITADWGTAATTNTITLRTMTVDVQRSGIVASQWSLPFNSPSASLFPTQVGSPTSITNVPNLGALIDAGAATGSVGINGFVQTLPGSPFTVTARFKTNFSQGNFSNGGIVLGDATAKLLTFGPANTSTIKYDHWTNATSFSAEQLNVTYSSGDMLFRLQDNGTNIIASTSSDGINFLPVFQESRTTWLTSGATRAGFFFNPQFTGVTSVHPTIACLYWNVTTP